MKREMLTTKEVAEYLSINEKQVYRLVRDRKIPATRITGKWLFPKELINEWILASAKENVTVPPKEESAASQIVIAGSNDLALELLAKHINLNRPHCAVSVSNIGSLGGLVALQKGNCHIAASHLLDLETGEYNSSFIRKHFPELKATVLNLAYRDQGLIVKKKNPLRIKSLKDLVNKKAAFVNRQEGSGTRVFLDYRLKEDAIRPGDIRGYSRIAYTHMETALDIFSGSADVGIGIFAAAKLLNLDFIPLATERFDLIIPSQDLQNRAVKALREVLCSDEFKVDVNQMGGYNTRDTGKIMYQME
jgi:excisionase family DNA binding protein